MSIKDDTGPFLPLVIAAVVFAVVLAYAAGVTTFVLDQFRDAEAPQAHARIAEPSERPSPPISAEPEATDSEHREPAVEAKPADPAARPSWELGTEPDESDEAHTEQADPSAPAISVVWQHFLGRGRENVVAASAPDSHGNVYIGGRFRGELAIPGSTKRYAASNRDAFLIKLDPDGRVQWSKVISGPKQDVIWDIEVSPDNDVLIGGSKASNGYLASFSSEGVMTWDQAIRGSAPSAVKAVAIGPSGDVYCGGVFSGRAVLESGEDGIVLKSSGGRDIFVGRVGVGRDFSWAFRLGNGGRSAIRYLAVDGNGDIVAIGYFKGRLDLDPGAGIRNAGSGAGMDTFIAKYDPTGRYLWNASPASTGNAMFGALLVVDDRYYAGGHFTHSMVVDNGERISSSAPGGDWDLFLLEYSSQGTLLSADAWGSSGDDLMFYLEKDRAHTLLIGASSGGSAAIGFSKSEESFVALPNRGGDGELAGLVHTIAVSGNTVFAAGETVGFPFPTDGDLFVGRYELTRK